MGIYLPNMEMPTSCSGCQMLEGDRMDGLCHAASKWLDDDEYWTWYVYPEGDMDDSKPCNCPLVPVPTHGRLIDANHVMNNMRSEHPYVQNAIRATIIAAPTIIPAEPPKEEV